MFKLLKNIRSLFIFITLIGIIHMFIDKFVLFCFAPCPRNSIKSPNILLLWKEFFLLYHYSQHCPPEAENTIIIGLELLAFD